MKLVTSVVVLVLLTFLLANLFNNNNNNFFFVSSQLISPSTCTGNKNFKIGRAYISVATDCTMIAEDIDTALIPSLTIATMTRSTLIVRNSKLASISVRGGENNHDLIVTGNTYKKAPLINVINFVHVQPNFKRLINISDNYVSYSIGDKVEYQTASYFASFWTQTKTNVFRNRIIIRNNQFYMLRRGHSEAKFFVFFGVNKLPPAVGASENTWTRGSELDISENIVHIVGGETQTQYMSFLYVAAKLYNFRYDNIFISNNHFFVKAITSKNTTTITNFYKHATVVTFLLSNASHFSVENFTLYDNDLMFGFDNSVPDTVVKLRVSFLTLNNLKHLKHLQSAATLVMNISSNRLRANTLSSDQQLPILSKHHQIEATGFYISSEKGTRNLDYVLFFDKNAVYMLAASNNDTTTCQSISFTAFESNVDWNTATFSDLSSNMNLRNTTVTDSVQCKHIVLHRLATGTTTVSGSTFFCNLTPYDRENPITTPGITAFAVSVLEGVKDSVVDSFIATGNSIKFYLGTTSNENRRDGVVNPVVGVAYYFHSNLNIAFTGQLVINEHDIIHISSTNAYSTSDIAVLFFRGTFHGDASLSSGDGGNLIIADNKKLILTVYGGLTETFSVAILSFALVESSSAIPSGETEKEKVSNKMNLLNILRNDILIKVRAVGVSNDVKGYAYCMLFLTASSSSIPSGLNHSVIYAQQVSFVENIIRYHQVSQVSSVATFEASGVYFVTPTFNFVENNITTDEALGILAMRGDEKKIIAGFHVLSTTSSLTNAKTKITATSNYINIHCQRVQTFIVFAFVFPTSPDKTLAEKKQTQEVFASSNEIIISAENNAIYYGFTSMWLFTFHNQVSNNNDKENRRFLVLIAECKRNKINITRADIPVTNVGGSTTPSTFRMIRVSGDSETGGGFSLAPESSFDVNRNEVSGKFKGYLSVSMMSLSSADVAYLKIGTLFNQFNATMSHPVVGSFATKNNIFHFSFLSTETKMKFGINELKCNNNHVKLVFAGSSNNVYRSPIILASFVSIQAQGIGSVCSVQLNSFHVSSVSSSSNNNNNNNQLPVVTEKDFSQMIFQFFELKLNNNAKNIVNNVNVKTNQFVVDLSNIVFASTIVVASTTTGAPPTSTSTANPNEGKRLDVFISHTTFPNTLIKVFNVNDNSLEISSAEQSPTKVAYVVFLNATGSSSVANFPHQATLARNKLIMKNTHAASVSFFFVEKMGDAFQQKPRLPFTLSDNTLTAELFPLDDIYQCNITFFVLSKVNFCDLLFQSNDINVQVLKPSSQVVSLSTTPYAWTTSNINNRNPYKLAVVGLMTQQDLIGDANITLNSVSIEDDNDVVDKITCTVFYMDAQGIIPSTGGNDEILQKRNFEHLFRFNNVNISASRAVEFFGILTSQYPVSLVKYVKITNNQVFVSCSVADSARRRNINVMSASLVSSGVVALVFAMNGINSPNNNMRTYAISTNTIVVSGFSATTRGFLDTKQKAISNNYLDISKESVAAVFLVSKILKIEKSNSALRIVRNILNASASYNLTLAVFVFDKISNPAGNSENAYVRSIVVESNTISGIPLSPRQSSFYSIDMASSKIRTMLVGLELPIDIMVKRFSISKNILQIISKLPARVGGTYNNKYLAQSALSVIGFFETTSSCTVSIKGNLMITDNLFGIFGGGLESDDDGSEGGGEATTIFTMQTPPTRISLSPLTTSAGTPPSPSPSSPPSPPPATFVPSSPPLWQKRTKKIIPVSIFYLPSPSDIPDYISPDQGNNNNNNNNNAQCTFMSSKTSPLDYVITISRNTQVEQNEESKSPWREFSIFSNISDIQRQALSLGFEESLPLTKIDDTNAQFTIECNSWSSVFSTKAAKLIQEGGASSVSARPACSSTISKSKTFYVHETPTEKTHSFSESDNASSFSFSGSEGTNTVSNTISSSIVATNSRELSSTGDVATITETDPSLTRTYELSDTIPIPFTHNEIETALRVTAGITATTAVLASMTPAPSMLFTQARQQSVQGLISGVVKGDCSLDIPERDDNPSPVESPMQLRLGDSAFRYVIGTLIGNIILVLGFCVLTIFIAWICTKIWMPEEIEKYFPSMMKKNKNKKKSNNNKNKNTKKNETETESEMKKSDKKEEMNENNNNNNNSNNNNESSEKKEKDEREQEQEQKESKNQESSNNSKKKQKQDNYYDYIISLVERAQVGLSMEFFVALLLQPTLDAAFRLAILKEHAPPTWHVLGPIFGVFVCIVLGISIYLTVFSEVVSTAQYQAIEVLPEELRKLDKNTFSKWLEYLVDPQGEWRPYFHSLFSFSRVYQPQTRKHLQELKKTNLLKMQRDEMINSISQPLFDSYSRVFQRFFMMELFVQFLLLLMPVIAHFFHPDRNCTVLGAFTSIIFFCMLTYMIIRKPLCIRLQHQVTCFATFIEFLASFLATVFATSDSRDWLLQMEAILIFVNLGLAVSLILIWARGNGPQARRMKAFWKLVTTGEKFHFPSEIDKSALDAENQESSSSDDDDNSDSDYDEEDEEPLLDENGEPTTATSSSSSNKRRKRNKNKTNLRDLEGNSNNNNNENEVPLLSPSNNNEDIELQNYSSSASSSSKNRNKNNDENYGDRVDRLDIAIRKAWEDLNDDENDLVPPPAESHKKLLTIDLEELVDL